MKAKRLLSILLAFVMIVSMCPLSAFAADAEPADDSAVRHPVLKLDTRATAVVSGSGVPAYFQFTPEFSCTYTFTGHGEGDSYGLLYDSQMNLLEYNDDGAGNLNFLITYDLEAGQTYILGARFYDEYASGTLEVSVAHDSPSFTVVTDPAPSCTADGLNTYTCACGMTWTETIAACHFYSTGGICAHCGAGPSVLEAGTAETLTLDCGLYYFYAFTPAVSGMHYVLFPEHNTSMLSTIQDSNGEHLTIINTSASDHDFTTVYLEAGQTYRLTLYNNYEYSITTTITADLCPIPTSVSGYVDDTSIMLGDQTDYHLIYTPDYSYTEISVSFSDPSIAEAAIYGNIIQFNTLAVGQTEVTVSTASGYTDSFTLTVKDAIDLTPGEMVEMDLDLMEFQVFHYTPETTGYHAFRVLCDAFDSDMTALESGDWIYHDGYIERDSGSYLYYYLTAGQTYALEVYKQNWPGSFSIQAGACTAPTALTLPETYTGYLGSCATIQANFDSPWAWAPYEWSYSGVNFDLFFNYLDCEVDFIEEGTGSVTVSTTDGTLSATCQITVEGTQILEPGVSQSVTIPGDGSTTVNFTTDEAGWYCFYIPMDIGKYLEDSLGNTVSACHSPCNGRAYLLEADSEYQLTLTNYNYRDCTLDVMVGHPETIYHGGSVSVELEYDTEKFFVLSPETNGYYYLRLPNNSMGLWLYDENCESVSYQVYYENDVGYWSCYLEGGSNYLLSLANDSGEVLFAECPAPDEIYISFYTTTMVTGGTARFEVYFNPGYARDNFTVTLSDDSIAEITNDGTTYYSLTGLNPGDVTVTVTTDSGLSSSQTFHVIESTPLTLGESHNFSLAYNESIYFEFTAEADGYYAFRVDDEDLVLELRTAQGNYYVDDADDLCGGDGFYYYYYYLNAGTSYHLGMRGWGSISNATILGDLCTAPTALTLPDAITGTAGSYIRVNAELGSPWEFGSFDWEFSNTCVEIASPWVDAELVCNEIGSGTLTVTTMAADGSPLTGSTEVTVLPAPILTEDEPIAVKLTPHSSQPIAFTPESDGFYIFFSDDAYDIQFHTEDYDYPGYQQENDLYYVFLNGGTTYYANTYCGHSSVDASLAVAPIASVETGTLPNISAPANSPLRFSFTPTQSGAYYLETPMDVYVEVLDQQLNYLSVDQFFGSDSRYFTFQLEAGQSYCFRGSNYGDWDATGLMLLDRSGSPSAIELEAPASVLVGLDCSVEVNYTPIFASEACTWTVDDPSIASITYSDDTVCVLEGLAAGTVTVTCTTESGLSASAVVEVLLPLTHTLTLDEPLTVTLEPGGYLHLEFTVPEDGSYGLFFPRSGLTYHDSYYNNLRTIDGTTAMCSLVNAGDLLEYNFCNDTNEERTFTFTMAKTKVPETQQINHPVIYTTPGTGVYVELQFPVLEEWDPPVSFQVDNEVIAFVSYEEPYRGCGVRGLAEGTANLIITTASGRTITCPIHVIASTGGELTLDEETPVRYIGDLWSNYTFTPAESGYYSMYLSAPVACVVELYNDSAYRYTEVSANATYPLNYYLNGGETYHISTTAMEYGCYEGTIRFSKAVYVTGMEITRAPDRTDYVDNYIRQALDLTGLEMNITWSDGSTTAYSYDDTFINIGYWQLGTHVDEDAGTVTLNCCEGTVDLPIILKENPVASIEILDDEIPSLVEDAYHSNHVYYRSHVLTRKMKLLVTYTDGTTETLYACDNIDGYYFRIDDDLNGPGASNNITVSILGASDTYSAQFTENPVASISLVSDPDPLVFGEDSQVVATKDGTLALEPDYGCRYEGLTFRIDYTDGTSETVSFEDLYWPDHDLNYQNSLYLLPEYRNYPVEAMPYSNNNITGFEYASRIRTADENGQIPMILHYMGKYLRFTVTLEEQTSATEIASGWSGYTTWSLTDDGTLTFSGEGAMKNYTTKDGMPWYAYKDQITKVVIKEGVTAIGSYAFYGMPVLSRIRIASTVTAIGDYAFKGCEKLNGVVLPAGLTQLGDSAFYGCTSLTAIDIPASLWTIKPYTFKNCTALESVTFHEGNLQKISDGAFYGTAVKAVTFPDCLDILDVYSFKNCAALKTINLGSGLTEIREAVFYGTAIPAITIPEGITKIGPYAFKNCVALETIDLPESLTSVGEASFYACTALASVELPDSVTAIGNYAFRKCTALTSITFGYGLTTIGESSFYGCTGLTEIVIPDSVTTIKGYAFKGCTGVTAVTLGSGVQALGESAFHTCTGLKRIVFPASLTSIGDYCFSGSWNLWQITFQGDAPAIGAGAFKGLVATAYYPSGNASYTTANMLGYGGTITWTAL